MADPEPEGQPCPHCGAPVPPGTPTCPGCGRLAVEDERLAGSSIHPRQILVLAIVTFVALMGMILMVFLAG